MAAKCTSDKGCSVTLAAVALPSEKFREASKPVATSLFELLVVVERL